jgi:Salmonella virulence plasmid 65kDa B protein
VRDDNSPREQHTSPSDGMFGLTAPRITLPKGGGAISGIGEKFAANPVTGTGSMTVTLFTSPGRSGFGPQLSLSYDSGAGNGPFGFGWTLSVPSITRRTDKGLPKYFDAEESDIFILSGAEDLVPVLVNGNKGWERQFLDSPASEPGYTVQRYRPRIGGLFARIERWTNKTNGMSHWRSISKDNITTFYGKRDDARIVDPADETRIFAWLICESYDDKENAILYRYKPEDDANIDPAAPHERNRLIARQFPQRYLKNIRYGNRTPRKAGEDLALRRDWLFEVVFDYGEHHEAAPTTGEVQAWPVRQDPFSLFRATFDIRTYRLCRRVLMFHHFPDELNGTVDSLVRSTSFEYKESSVASFIASVTLAKEGFAPVNRSPKSWDEEKGPRLVFFDPTQSIFLADMVGDGLSDIVRIRYSEVCYWPNLGYGHFGPKVTMGMPRCLKAWTFSIHGASISPISTARVIPTSSMSATTASRFTSTSLEIFGARPPGSRIFHE